MYIAGSLVHRSFDLIITLWQVLHTFLKTICTPPPAVSFEQCLHDATTSHLTLVGTLLESVINLLTFECAAKSKVALLLLLHLH